ncbi:MAG: LuxR C-terminal-related transcriptional regulator [Burkholderiales bacterium]|nr:LuxR C-terminal-related transcriptional regulator [Burkholderiales bacterium]
MKTKTKIQAQTQTQTSAPVISETEKKMLELLIKGASSKIIAQSLGYKDGTARVYLHTLYKRIGVNNKTSAVTWYLGNKGKTAGVLGAPGEALPARPESFGDFAVETDLLASLGVMAIFVGPHSKMWEVASRLKGAASRTDPDDVERIRIKSRQLWNALLQGDFAYGKKEFDAGYFSKLFVESTTDAVVVSSLLMLGGYSARAKKSLGAMPARKDASIGITRDERAALVAISDAVDNQNESALTALHQLAKDGVSKPVFRQLVLVALFHIYKMRDDLDRARVLANTIWAEAEAVRHHLQALGEKTLTIEGRVPEPPKVAAAVLNRYLEKLMS